MPLQLRINIVHSAVLLLLNILGTSIFDEASLFITVQLWTNKNSTTQTVSTSFPSAYSITWPKLNTTSNFARRLIWCVMDYRLIRALNDAPHPDVIGTGAGWLYVWRNSKWTGSWKSWRPPASGESKFTTWTVCENSYGGDHPENVRG